MSSLIGVDGRPRRRLGLAVAVAAVLLMAGCVAPTTTDDGYRVKLAGTVRDISSAIASAKVAVGLELAGKMAFALTDEIVSDAEADADSALASWESRQPPSDAALRLHDRAKDTLHEAVDALESLRIAVRRGDRAAIRRALAGLDQPDTALGELDRVVSG